MRGNFVFWSVSSLLSFGAYLLYVDKFDLSEAIAGAIASSFAAWLFLVLHKVQRTSYRPKLSWFKPSWKLSYAVFYETYLLFLELIKRMAGRKVRGSFLYFPHVRKGGRRGPALRAFIIYGVSFSPNSYLVAIDKDENRYVLRQLSGRKLSPVDRSFLELQ